MGKVILAGAGPGDPDLITVKAARYLQRADVIIKDRLVSRELLERYARPDAQIIDVGKKGYHPQSVRQEQINDLLCYHYRPGKLVVRLKGGDTAFFSNILDELLTLNQHDIPYEIVPGITAASGASAYAGIPLTARGFSDSVRFITLYNKQERTTQYWQELAHYDGTIVCYMSAKQLQYMLLTLLKYGIDPSCNVAIIEQATTPVQRTTVFMVGELHRFDLNDQSPTLIIIGKVAGLYHAFHWKENSYTATAYFDPEIQEQENFQNITCCKEQVNV